MRKYLQILFSLCILVTCAFVFSSCKKDDDKKPDPGQEAVYIAFDKEHGDDLGDRFDYAILGTDKFGYFFDFQEENSNIPAQLAIHNGNPGKERVELVITFDDEGMPETILSEDFTVALGNYVENRFNAAIVTKNGESYLFEHIETDIDWDDYKNAISQGALRTSLQQKGTPGTVTKWITVATGSIGCALAIAAAPTGIGLVLTALKCAGAADNLMTAMGWWENSDIEEDISYLGHFGFLGDCIKSIVNPSPLQTASCVTSYAGTVGAGASEILGRALEYLIDFAKDILENGEKKKPNAPKGVTAGQHSQSIVVSWWESTGATRYDIYRFDKTAGAYKEIGSIIDIPKPIIFTDKFPVAGENTYKVMARNIYGDSDFSSSVTCNFDEEDDNEEWVVINGVKWATKNVGAPGTFASSPEAFGGYFDWEEAPNACPAGWHIPKSLEVSSLNNATYKWTTLNDVKGCSFDFGDKSIFIPAAGYYFFGSLSSEGTAGRYIFDDDGRLCHILFYGDQWGKNFVGMGSNRYTLRCVKDE